MDLGQIWHEDVDFLQFQDRVQKRALETGNESHEPRGGKFLNWLSYYQLLKKESTPWSFIKFWYFKLHLNK
jgi:hypothetical protein